MKLVVDTNVLFSFFNERSKARELSLLPSLELYSPSFALDEIEQHKSKILETFSLSEAQFTVIEKLLGTVVKFVGKEEYSEFLSRAMKISPDLDDADFFALALELNCSIWSKDKELKRQTQVRVLSTKELIELLG
ncbi:MAG: PIN domain-containing protein [Hadesarchaea archaeon]|nr:PIN domain-containing protein [Hadesarchaea archaeon]